MQELAPVDAVVPSRVFLRHGLNYALKNWLVQNFCKFFEIFFCYNCSMKEILKHAIEIEGTRQKLAAAVGVEPSTIFYWEKKSLPRRREEQLVKLYGRRKLKQWKPPQ